MSKKDNSEKTNDEIKWLSTSANVRTRVKDGKIYFIIQESNQAFSYSLNFFKKILENSNN